jgi:hypothetical protein
MRQIIPETDSDYEDVVVVERPDGFYWKANDEERECGPFPSLLAAMEDAASRSEADTVPQESVSEAEAELGVSDWIDEETGEPAEENAPRLEQH